MSISSKTRKIIWARSGNRCSICRLELVQNSNLSNNKIIVGEECHIISSRKNGPRGSFECSYDFDDYRNILLLCANDHIKIDRLVNEYSPSRLMKIKLDHEKWVKDKLEIDSNSFTNDKYRTISLPRINTGKEVLNIVRGAHFYQFDNDEFETEKEASIISDFLGDLQDYGDISSDLDYRKVVNLSFEFSNRIKEIEELGFIFFGVKRKVKVDENDLMNIGVIIILRKGNPFIIGNFMIGTFHKTYSTKDIIG